MKQTLSVIICLALGGAVMAEPPTEPPKKKAKPATHGQMGPTPGHVQPAIKGGGAYRRPVRTFSPAMQPQPVTGGHRQYHPQTMNATAGAPRHLPAVQKFQNRQFNIATRPKAGIPSATFRADRHIRGSENWKGAQYQAFRNYHSQWHNRDWWRHHHHRIVFIYGGWYAWDAGWWYPAWGYDTNAYYPYDGPIYAYNNLPPDQVIANVQSALQEQGYYTGEIDGILGPLTRAALARYQQDHGLYITSAIDQPTLQSLGMS